MMSWEQMDRLNEITKDQTIGPEERTRLIREHMRTWAMLVNEHEFDIDPAKESVKARIPVPGQIGRYAYPDVYMDTNS